MGESSPPSWLSRVDPSQGRYSRRAITVHSSEPPDMEQRFARSARWGGGRVFARGDHAAAGREQNLRACGAAMRKRGLALRPPIRSAHQEMSNRGIFSFLVLFLVVSEASKTKGFAVGQRARERPGLHSSNDATPAAVLPPPGLCKRPQARCAPHADGRTFLTSTSAPRRPTD